MFGLIRFFFTSPISNFFIVYITVNWCYPYIEVYLYQPVPKILKEHLNNLPALILLIDGVVYCYRLDTNLRRDIFYYGMMDVSEAQWDQVWSLYNTEPVASAKVDMRRGLARTKDTQLINKYV